jgi:hypothetical protein
MFPDAYPHRPVVYLDPIQLLHGLLPSVASAENDGGNSTATTVAPVGEKNLLDVADSLLKVVLVEVRVS